MHNLKKNIQTENLAIEQYLSKFEYLASILQSKTWNGLMFSIEIVKSVQAAQNVIKALKILEVQWIANQKKKWK